MTCGKYINMSCLQMTPHCTCHWSLENLHYFSHGVMCPSLCTQIASGLQLKASKKICMLIHSCCLRFLPQLEIVLNGNHHSTGSGYKYLCVIISDTLSWSQHIDLVHSRAAKGIGLFHWLSWFLPRRALCTMYNTYILPYLMDALWGTCTAEVWNVSRTMLPASD